VSRKGGGGEITVVSAGRSSGGAQALSGVGTAAEGYPGAGALGKGRRGTRR